MTEETESAARSLNFTETLEDTGVDQPPGEHDIVERLGKLFSELEQEGDYPYEVSVNVEVEDVE